MTLTRPRKARILAQAGLRYVAGWLPLDRAEDVEQQIADAEPLVEDALARRIGAVDQ